MARKPDSDNHLLSTAINVSCGHDPVLFAELRAWCETSHGVWLADIHSDPDHNRSVITLIGTSAGLQQTISQIMVMAHTSVDFRQHTGVHPRVGVVDVVPIVPLSGLSPVGGDMNKAIACARECVVDLSNLGLASIIAYGHLNPAVAPHAHLGRKQALDSDIPHTLVGAREILIAFNMQLDTDDEGTAREIARKIRDSAGGLAGVRALAFSLAARGCVQVSTNIERYQDVSPAKVVRVVEGLARQAGVTIQDLELIGLAPHVAVEELKELDYHLRSSVDPVLEFHIQQAMQQVGLVE